MSKHLKKSSSHQEQNHIYIQLPLGQAQWIVNSYTGCNGGYRFYYWLVESSLSQLQDWAWLTVHPASVFIKDSFFL
ncbi:MAG: hypothetical protein LBQ77_07030, partial [Treponema sp.]|nr:hypothetical protein [Treponema sp.]